MLPRIFRTESEIRKRQINTLKIFNDNVIEVIEGTEYCIAFGSGKNELALQILLSKDFPNEKPKLKISPVVIHPWVNAEGEVVSAPGLLNFTVHSDLGRVVQAIIREFERTPPPLAANHSHVNTSSPIQFCRGVNPINVSSPNYTIGNYSNVNSFSPQSSLLSTSSTSVNRTIVFPELNTLSLDELKLLNDNVDKQDEFLENLPPIREMNKTLDDLLTQIEELADTNLAKKNKLVQLHAERTPRIETLTKLLNSNEMLSLNYQLLSDRYKPSNIKESLRGAAARADEQSESIAERFLSGELDVDHFVSSYIKSRTLSHTRKTKEEKLAHQLSELERAGF
ncbi:Vacuolar protein sorting 37A [Carabus blaptoides fortunei]